MNQCTIYNLARNKEKTMNENEVTTPAVESPPANGKPRKKVKKAAKSPASGLSSQRIAVLKAAGKAGNAESIAERVKTNRRAAYHHLWCMRNDGLVKNLEVDVDGVKELLFERTSKGNKVLGKAK